VKRKIVLTAVILILVLSLFPWNSQLKIHFINVGQGDSIFIETPDKKTILIDTGPEYKNYIAARDKVLPFIKRKGYNRVDMLLITHFHMDHAGGLDYLLKGIRVNKIIVPEKPKNTGMDYTEVSKGDQIQIGSVKLKVLYPMEDEESQDRNENCIVLKLEYKGFSALLTADAEADQLDTIAGQFDVLKVSHHGSKASFSDKMLTGSSIETAVISVGKNSFGHPSQEVIKALKAEGIRVFRTDIDGDISIITGGESYSLVHQ
jgi:competence protein ComEC